MKLQSADTDVRIEEELIKKFRAMNCSERFFKAVHLTDFVMKQSREAIAEANPNLNELEQKILFISVHYGEELAERVREYWKGKNEQ